MPSFPNHLANSQLAGVAGQRVLVTAGASGIGYAIAETLLSMGARVAVCDVAEAALAQARTALPGLLATRADVSVQAEVDAMFDWATAQLGGLDALVNNAGIAGPTGGVEEISVDDWRRCIDINLTGQFLCARRAVPLLRAAGGGSIVNMSSVAGKYGYAFRTPYAASKWAVVGLTESMAKELGPHNIRVNAIQPGIVEGPRIDNVIRDRARQLNLGFDEMRDKYLERVSLRRMVSPYDVAAMVAFLLSRAGANISGQALAVDGNVEAL